MTMKKIASVLWLLAAGLVGEVGATVLHVDVTTDNQYNLYISTSDSTQGTLVGSGNSWPSPQSFNATLTGGVTNYIHIVAQNLGGPGGVLGDFSLSDSAFQFFNLTQSLVTGVAGWSQNLSGFGNAYSAAVDEG